MSVNSDEQAAPSHREPPDGRSALGLSHLSPAYFGMVMATGVVSLAAQALGLPGVARVLFGLNLVVYVVLWALYLLRLTRYPRRFLGDMVDHLRGPGFFTIVAGTNILGSQFARLNADYRSSLALWAVSIVLWVVLTYTIFTTLTIKPIKPTLDQGISGAWLLAVVATQSIAVLGAILALHVGESAKLKMNFLALSMWLWGGMLYIWMMSLIFYRYTFFPFSPGDLSPPYWINMGAMAISTLAGSILVVNSPASPFLFPLQPFIKCFTVFYWVTGSWWIPMLVVLAVWRHVYRRFPLQYDPLYWGAVFPLGMYAVSTHMMIQALGLHFLSILPRVFLYVSLGAWALTFFGFLLNLSRRLGAIRS